MCLQKVPGIRWYTGIVTLNTEMYIDILRRHRDAVSRKYPEKWRTNIWCVPHDSAPPHHSVLLKYLLGQNNVTTQKHRSYSLDLAAADFYFYS